MRGAFITLEGMEGVGKSTNLKSIAARLEATGQRVLVTREPGGTELGERIREMVLGSEKGSLSAVTETLLMFAARAHHIETVIEPALISGAWVLCDRFTDATFAYQGGGRGVDGDFLDRLAAAVQGTLKPDLTILLDAPPSVGLSRIGDRPLDHFESEDTRFFERVRSAYQQIAHAEPDRVIVVDADRDRTAVASELASQIDSFVQRFESADG